MRRLLVPSTLLFLWQQEPTDNDCGTRWNFRQWGVPYEKGPACNGGASGSESIGTG